MTNRTPSVVEDCKDAILACDGPLEVMNVLQGYFEHVVWSLEKQEWDNMTDLNQLHFCELLYKKLKEEG